MYSELWLLPIFGLFFIIIGFAYSKQSDDSIKKQILDRNKQFSITTDMTQLPDSIRLWRKRYTTIFTYIGLSIIVIGFLMIILEQLLN